MIHILLVDASITIQRVVELTFSDGPYVVTSVSDGSHALDAALQSKPDVVLVRVKIPGLTGYQVCALIKKQLPGTPVLLMVGTFEPLNKSEARQCEADDIVVIPFESQALIKQVEQHIERAKARKSPADSTTVSKKASFRAMTAPQDVHQLLSSPSPHAPRGSKSLRVFLCHASEDKPAVRALYKRFRAEGFQPWLDEEDLLPGEDWRHAITKELRQADAVVVCLSRGSVTKAGYIQKEIAVALDILAEQPEGSIFVIPLLLEDCQIPDRLTHLHAARLPLDEGFARVCLALRRRSEMESN